MDTLIQDTITLTNNLQDRVITYMSNDQLQDADDEWVSLRRVFFENYNPNDTFYVPVRRLISPDWLKWHKNNQRVRIGVNTSTNERIFSVYCLFLPYLENFLKLIIHLGGIKNIPMISQYPELQILFQTTGCGQRYNTTKKIHILRYLRTMTYY